MFYLLALLVRDELDLVHGLVYALLVALDDDTVAVISRLGDRDLGGGHLLHLLELGASLAQQVAVMLLGDGDSDAPLLLEPSEHLPLGPHHLTNESTS